MLRLKLIILILLVAACVPSHGRSYGKLTANEGLSDLLVSVMYKDSEGYLWIGTSVGIDRFDGVEVKNYCAADKETGRVYSIIELPEKRMLAGCKNGLFLIDRKDGKAIPFLDDEIHDKVYSLLYDRDVLYIGTEKGLYVCGSDGSLSRPIYTQDVLLASNEIRDICLIDGCIWMATDSGLCSWNLTSNEYKRHHYINQNNHNCLFVDMVQIEGKIYLATNDRGVLLFDLEDETFTSYTDVGCNVISCLSYDNDGSLYVGTDGNGVCRIDIEQAEIKEYISHGTGHTNPLPSNSVYSILADRDGLLWIGYYQHGLSYTLYQSDLFTVYSYHPYVDTHGMAVRSISLNGDEMLVGLRDGLFYLDKGRGLFKAFHTPELRSNIIFCSLYHKGKYYVGTYGGGMYVFDPKTQNISEFDQTDLTFSKGTINCIKEDSGGNLWIGTSAGTYCYKDGVRLYHFNSSNSKLPSDLVHEIFFDSKGKGWICTEGGICIWNPTDKNIRVDCFPENFEHDKAVRAVFEDSEHRIYFGPDKDRIFSSDLNMTDIEYLSKDIKEVRFITEDKYGSLLIGTNNGLYSYDKEENLIPYGFVYGVPNPNFNFCTPVTDDEGNIWMGNAEGLLCMNQSKLTENNHSPYGLSVTDVCKHGKSSITICFSDFSYTDHTSMVFEYYLDREDKDWQLSSGKSKITYFDLKSGKYVFRVRKAGRPETEVVYQFDISSSYYIIYVLTLVFLVSSALLIYKLSSKKKRGDSLIEQNEQEEKSEVVEKYKSTRLSPEDCRKIAESLEIHMRKEKPYTNPHLKIADLASAINTSSHSLSYVFNQYMNTNFYDYINEYRVEEFCSLVNTDAYSRYTLTALAELCGFSSRASFFRSFKKSKGVTPSEFVHNERIIE